MVNIQDSALWTEVEAILSSDEDSTLFYWTAVIHVNGEDYSPIKLIESDNVRDFHNSHMDQLTVKLQIQYGTWAKVIYPNRSTLEITLFKTPLSVNSSSLVGRPIPQQRMQARLVLEGLNPPTGNDVDRISEETLNLREIAEINFSLMNTTAYLLRMVTIGATFRNATNQDVIKAVLAKEASKVITDKLNAVDIIEMVPANNTTKRMHIGIPQGLPLLDIAGYLQDRVGGVYNTGINLYIQNKSIFIYPLYDTTRVATDKYTLTIIKVPKTLLTGADRTYRTDGDSTFIMATSDSTFKDDAGTNYLNTGNGLRFADADTFMHDYASTQDNKATVKRSGVMNEFISEDIGSNNLKNSDRLITANPYREYSKLAKSKGGIYTFVWDNANVSILYPGMTVRILYISASTIKELNGVLLFAHSNSVLTDRTINSGSHRTNAALGVFVNAK